jgi:hypothetical protein
MAADYGALLNIFYNGEIGNSITVNLPIFYMARDVMFWMRENLFRGPLEGMGGPWVDGP